MHCRVPEPPRRLDRLPCPRQCPVNGEPIRGEQLALEEETQEFSGGLRSHMRPFRPPETVLQPLSESHTHQRGEAD